MNKLDQITVTIPTLNEEKNISKCIDSVKKSGIKNIIVIDGGSTDKTIKILQTKKIKVIQTKKKGLGFQRSIGVKKTKTKYISLIDADMRTTKDSFIKMIKDLENANYAGVEARIKPSNKNLSYFDKSYQAIMEININKDGPRRMIGTPTLWRTKILKENNFRPTITAATDDTDVCYRAHQKGHVFGGSSGIVYHVHRSSFRQYLKKYLWYGKGDAQFVISHPERFFSILKHQLFNYPIKFSIISLIRFDFYPIPFMVMSGSLRFIGMNLEFLNRIFQRRDKIYNT
jgi:glycosyltransferase involved in cell wall biosynthesis